VGDERLQRSRRAARDDDPEAQARLLAERMRSGDLGEDRLLLAALLGDPAARLATGVEPDPRRCDRALAALAAESPGAFVRVAMACVRAVRPLVDRYDPASAPLADEVLAATERWLVDGSTDGLAALGARAGAALTRSIVGTDRPHRRVTLAIDGLHFALVRRAVLAAGKAKGARTGVVNAMRRALEEVEEAVGAATWSAQAALFAALGPWLLAPTAEGVAGTKEALRRLTRPRAKPTGAQCVCTGCRGCHERTRCPTAVRAKGRDRCGKCWPIFQDAERTRRFLEDGWA